MPSDFRRTQNVNEYASWNQRNLEFSSSYKDARAQRGAAMIPDSGPRFSSLNWFQSSVPELPPSSSHPLHGASRHRAILAFLLFLLPGVPFPVTAPPQPGELPSTLPLPSPDVTLSLALPGLCGLWTSLWLAACEKGVVTSSWVVTESCSLPSVSSNRDGIT